MKFETYAHMTGIYHQPNFYKDPCKDARAQGVNARMRISSRVRASRLLFKYYVIKLGENVCGSLSVLAALLQGEGQILVLPFNLTKVFPQIFLEKKNMQTC